jgi:hypothetical protein
MKEQFYFQNSLQRNVIFDKDEPNDWLWTLVANPIGAVFGHFGKSRLGFDWEYRNSF